MKKRALSLLLAVVMVLSLLPASAFAAENDEVLQDPPVVTEETKEETQDPVDGGEDKDPAEEGEDKTPEGTQEPEETEAPEESQEPEESEEPEESPEPEESEEPEESQEPEETEVPEESQEPEETEAPEETELPEETLLPELPVLLAQPRANATPDPNNIALGKTVYVSSEKADSKNKAVDGNIPVGGGAQWSSQNGAPQWLVVDLGENVTEIEIEKFHIWYNGPCWPTNYEIQTAGTFDEANPNDGWTTIYSVTRNGGGNPVQNGEGQNIADQTNNRDVITTTSAPALTQGTKVNRFVRLYASGISQNIDLGIVEFEIIKAPFRLPQATQEQIAATPNGNLFRPRPQDAGDPVTAEATDVEPGTTYYASNAIDGMYNTRWASKQERTEKTLTVDMGAERAVGYVKLFWNYRSITEFYIEVSPDGTEWGEAYHYGEAGNEAYRVTKEQALAFTPVMGRYVRLRVTGHDGKGDKPGNDNYPNVELCEIEAYKSENAIPLDPGSVAEKVEFSVKNGRVVMDTAAAEAFAESKGWEFTFDSFGCGIEQIVDEGGVIHTPLVDTVVEMDAYVTRTFDGVGGTNAKSPFELTIKGEHTANVGNAKPRVIPELMEWYSSTSQKGKYYTLTAGSRIVAPATLSEVAGEVQADIEDLFGYTPAIVSSGAAAGDIELALDPSKASEGFDEETYLMEVTDKVVITATDATGVYWGTRSALQALKLSGGKNTIPQGTARDYPEFRLRGYVMDVGRKPVTMDMLYEIAKNMSWYKLNDFHVHLNDNLIAIENYGYRSNSGWGSEEAKNEAYAEGNRAYAAFRLESSLQEEAGANPLAARDYHYTKAEFSQFITDSAKLGVTVVPEIDTPAHAKAITDAFPSIREPANFVRHALNDHFNLSGRFDESLAKAEAIFNDYLGDGTFHSGIVHFGADEYYPSADMYRKFHKAMIAFLKSKNVTVRTWGSLTEMSSDAPQYQYSKEETAGVQMDVWNTGWANPKAMYDLGFDLINVTDGPSYMVPNGSGGRSGYGDYLDLTSIYNWAPNCIGGTWFPAGDSQILGSAYAMWGDSLLDMAASGLDEIDLFDRFYDTLPVIAVRQWGEGGDGLDRTLSALQTDAAITGLAPQTNPYSVVEPDENGKVFEYLFDTGDGTADTSAYGHDLTLHGATVENGKLSVKGGSSYAETGLDFLGWGSELTFTINVTKAPTEQYGEVIFESDRIKENSDFPYNEYAIKALAVAGDSNKWHLGFSRELYDYEFSYDFTVGQEYTLTLITAQQKPRPKGETGTKDTKLVVKGDESAAITLMGKMEAKPGLSNTDFMGNKDVPNSSLELPVARIGSKTKAFTGTIDNIGTTAPEIEEPELPPAEGTVLVNLALNKPIVAQSSGESTVGKVTDGNVAHESGNAWEPSAMKTTTPQTPQWFVVDLGEEVAGMNLSAEMIAANYFMQAWPQKYKIETTSDDPSDPNANWTTLIQIERSGRNGWIGSVVSANHNVHQEGSRDVGGYALKNSDVIDAKIMENGAKLQRYIRFYAEEVQKDISETDHVRVIEFMVFARVPECEGAENIKAYQIAADKAQITWDEKAGTYYQVYAKAPGGAWECVSGEDAVEGNVFIHDGYQAGTIYQVLTPASDVNSPLSPEGVEAKEVYTYDEKGYVVNTTYDRITYSEGWSWWTESGYYGEGVKYADNPTTNLTAEFMFVGNGIQVIGGQKPSQAGEMTVEIDGVPAGKAIYTADTQGHQRVVFEKTGLDNGLHTIKLTGTNGSGKRTVEIEAFRVLVPVESIALTAEGLAGSKLTIATGDKTATNVTATVTPVNGSGEFVWTSSNEEAATVNSTELTPGPEGKMVATITPKKGNSTTTVTVADKSDPTVKAELAVTVIQSVENVILPDGQHSASLYLNGVPGQSNKIALLPQVMPENATNKKVTYTSSTPAVATVDASGVVTAQKVGTATITVTTEDGDHTTKCEVTVKSNPTAVTVKDDDQEVTVSKPVVIYNNTGASEVEGKRNSVVLKAAFTPADATETDIDWSRTDAASGLITLDPVVGDLTQVRISAVGLNERDVGEKTVKAASKANPAVEATFKVRVLRHLVHDVTVSVHKSAEPRPGETLEVSINQLNLDDAGVAGLTYQWLRDGVEISGATGKTYLITDEDIDKTLTAKVTATPTETYFYEGERTADGIEVGKNAAPAAPGLSAAGTTGSDGSITITGYVDGTAYEISSDGGASWNTATVGAGGVIGGLTAGDYQVRLAATATHEAGLPGTITVEDTTKTYFAVSFTATPADAGTVTLSKTSVETGSSVTATVKPNPGYAIAGVTVGGTALTGTEGTDGETVYTVGSAAAAVEFAVSFEAVKFTITHNLTGGLSCSLANGSDTHEVAYGAQEVITLVAQEGVSLPDRQGITVKTDDGAAFTGYEYSPTTGKITIVGGVTQNLTITAAGAPKRYQIAHNLSDHVNCSLTDHTVGHKAALEITLSADEGYRLTDGITVTMAGAALTAGTDYTYTLGEDKRTAKLAFAAGKITGNLEITAAAERILIPLVSVSIEGAAKVGARLEAKVNPAEAASYVNYQWLRLDADGNEEDAGEIAGATGMSRVITEASLGKKILVRVVAVDGSQFTGTVTSQPTALVIAADAPTVPVSIVELTTTSATMEVGKTLKLTATVRPEDATNQSLTWSSDNESVASVDGAGVVTAKALGTARITVTTVDGGKTATCVITVSNGSSSGGGDNDDSSDDRDDNTSSSTEKLEDGATAIVQTDKKTGTVTTTVKYESGVTVTSKTTAQGEVTATVKVPEKAEGEKTSVTVPSKVEFGPGHVAVIVKPDGSEEIIKTSIPTGDGMRVTVTESANVKIIDNTKKFDDVAENSWETDAVTFVTSREIFNGNGEGSFDPTGSMTRAMMFVVLANMENISAAGGETWYSNAMDWAVKTEVSDGTNPDQIVTREQLAVMLYRYMEHPEVENDALEQFADGDEVSNWAMVAMAWAVQNGIIKGRNGTHLAPQAPASRAEVAVMFQRYLALKK